MPSARVFYVLAFGTVLVVAGVVVPALGRFALVVDGLLLAAFAVDLRRSRGWRPEIRREWPRLLVQGVDAEVSVTIANRGDRELRLRLRETLHPGLAAAPQRTEVVVAAGGRSLWRYRIRPRHRGEHRAGPLDVRVLGAWGLAWRQLRVLGEEPRRVYPRVRWEGRVGQLLLLADRRALGRSPQRVQGLGSEPYALREYLPGDPPNKIHWKATARHGRMVTREDTWERGARLIILLDCARGMAAQATPAVTEAAVDDSYRSKLDYALAAALALTRVAASRGDRATVAAFSDRLERSVRIHGGHRSLHAAYGQLYDLEARLAEPAFDVAAEAAVSLESRRSTVVLFTSVVDLAAAELLRQAMLSLERRHRPILINLQDPELSRLALGEPETPEDAFAKVAALEILLANRRLGARLRHAGVRVVSTSADRLALEALEAYLAMFRGRGP